MSWVWVIEEKRAGRWSPVPQKTYQRKQPADRWLRKLAQNLRENMPMLRVRKYVRAD